MSAAARLLPLPLAAAVVLMVSGCGGPDPAAYVDHVNTVQESFSKQFQRLQTDMSPTSSASSNRTTLQRFQRAITAAIAELKATAAPDDVTGLHKDLLAELVRFKALIDQAEQKFASNNPAQIASAQLQLSTALGATAARLNETIAKINDKLH